MAVHARFCTARTALGAVGLWIVLKALEVLLYRVNSWHDAGHRPVSSVVAISFSHATIIKDDRPIFSRFCAGIYEGSFPDLS
jgi:hypothetical protein